MYFIKTPQIFKILFKDCIWTIPSKEKIVYLTFDDGPTPYVTDWVLDILDMFNAKATFFTLGKNVENNFDLYCRILKDGHSVGNHTNDHLKGWDVSTTAYVNNITKASELIDSSLFRPPYGKMTYNQYKEVKKLYTIVMWDILSGDFDSKMTADKSISKMKSKMKPGSIITFHDSIKAEPLLKLILPEILHYCKSLGYALKAIPTKN